MTHYLHHSTATPRSLAMRFRFRTTLMIGLLLGINSVSGISWADEPTEQTTETISDAKDEQPIDVLLVVGAGGADEFAAAFVQWREQWEATCERAELKLHLIGPSEAAESSDRDQLQTVLQRCATIQSVRPLWIVLIGHGTWDGNTAAFNLVGKDVSANELKEWVQPIERALVIVNCTSSSGPFINRLSGNNRVIVTATKSGSEQNYARFGEFFAAAFSALDADLDHDDSISIREAFLKAASDAERFYKEQGRLATEHALLDDNADKKGSSSALVLGKAQSKGDEQVDGDLAGRLSIPATTEAIRLNDEQIAKRDQLEAKLRELKQKFQNDDTAELRKQALPILLELAALYAQE